MLGWQVVRQLLAPPQTDGVQSFLNTLTHWCSVVAGRSTFGYARRSFFHPRALGHSQKLCSSWGNHTVPNKARLFHLTWEAPCSFYLQFATWNFIYLWKVNCDMRTASRKHRATKNRRIRRTQSLHGSSSVDPAIVPIGTTPLTACFMEADWLSVLVPVLVSVSPPLTELGSLTSDSEVRLQAISYYDRKALPRIWMSPQFRYLRDWRPLCDLYVIRRFLCIIHMTAGSFN